MYPYPTLPDAVFAGQLVADAVRHRTIDTAQEAAAAWVVLGYGLALSLPMPAGVAAAPGGTEYSAEAVARHLEHLDTQGVPPTAAAAQQAIPWQVVLTLLQQLLQGYLARRG